MKVIQKDVSVYRESLISLLRAMNHYDKIILQKTEENQFLLQFILSQNTEDKGITGKSMNDAREFVDLVV